MKAIFKILMHLTHEPKKTMFVLTLEHNNNDPQHVTEHIQTQIASSPSSNIFGTSVMIY